MLGAGCWVLASVRVVGDGRRRLDTAGRAVAVDAETGQKASAEFGQFCRAPVTWPVTWNDDFLNDGGSFGAGVTAEQDDAVGELEGFVDVVRDQQNGGRCRSVHVEEQVLHLEPGQRVERAEWFVEEEDAGVSGQGPRERRPLGHASRDLPRSVPGEFAEADEFDEFPHARAARGFGRAAWQAECDVVCDAAPRQETRFLKSDGCSVVEAGDGRAVDEHPTR